MGRDLRVWDDEDLKRTGYSIIYNSNMYIYRGAANPIFIILYIDLLNIPCRKNFITNRRCSKAFQP